MSPLRALILVLLLLTPVAVRAGGEWPPCVDLVPVEPASAPAGAAPCTRFFERTPAGDRRHVEPRPAAGVAKLDAVWRDVAGAEVRRMSMAPGEVVVDTWPRSVRTFDLTAYDAAGATLSTGTWIWPQNVPPSAVLAELRVVRTAGAFVATWQPPAGQVLACAFRAAPLPMEPLEPCLRGPGGWLELAKARDINLQVVPGDVVEVRAWGPGGALLGVGRARVDDAWRLWLPLVHIAAPR